MSASREPRLIASRRTILAIVAVLAALLALLLPASAAAAVTPPHAGLASPTTLALVGADGQIAAHQQLSRAAARLKIVMGKPSPAATTADQYIYIGVEQRANPNAPEEDLRPRTAGRGRASNPVDPSRLAAEGGGGAAARLRSITQGDRGSVGFGELPARARTFADFDEAAGHLQRFHGVDPRIASQRLHNIKRENGLPGDGNVLIDRTGNVFSPYTREFLGSLTRG